MNPNDSDADRDYVPPRKPVDDDDDDVTQVFDDAGKEIIAPSDFQATLVCQTAFYIDND